MEPQQRYRLGTISNIKLLGRKTCHSSIYSSLIYVKPSLSEERTEYVDLS